MRPAPLGFKPADQSTQYYHGEQKAPGPEKGIYLHGTRQRYQGNRTTDPCRCALCKDANRVYTRARRENRTVEEQQHYEDLPDRETLLELGNYDYTYGGLLPS